MLIVGLCLSTAVGLLTDYYLYHSFSLNYLLIGMSFSATAANLLKEEKLEKILRLYRPLFKSLADHCDRQSRFAAELPSDRGRGSIYARLYPVEGGRKNRRRLCGR